MIISGGGTGGHIFPAISIANEVKRRYPQAEILFVGAENRMEMEKVPAAGYDIAGLPVAGFDRKNLLKNIPVLGKLLRSLLTAGAIVQTFKPDIVVGVGGYASGPTLFMASQEGIPTLIQEQNSYAGVTNKLLAKRVAKVCVAYEGMERFFPAKKIVLSGNPVRQDLLQANDANREEAYAHFGLDPQKKTVVIIGGSLGARTLNESIIRALPELAVQSGVQFLWQSGNYYYKVSQEKLAEYPEAPVLLTEFIARMDLAYSLADLIISRAGASSISELSLLGKPVILVPSPNVAEDHQTQNAMALVKKEAAVLIPDKEAIDRLIPEALTLVRDDARLQALRENIKQLGLPGSSERIVDEIELILAKKGEKK